MKNGLSFDVEDWFQVFYGETIIQRSHWEMYPSVFEQMVNRMLEFLNDRELSATFFIVGWLAHKHPKLVKSIHDQGHEIASHSYWHKEIYKQLPDEFERDLILSKSCLEDVIGDRVVGFRAPGYSITPQMGWAIDLIQNCGYSYDSSLLYKKKGIEKLPNGLLEVPPNSIRFLNSYLPINGGFFFRALPFSIYSILLEMLRLKNKPLIFYIHSWEVYPPEHRIDIKGIKSFIQYYNTMSVVKKLDKLLKRGHFTSIQDLIQDFYLEMENEHEVVLVNTR